MTTALSDQFKVFGAGVDAADDPWTLQLKQAAMHAQEIGIEGICLDPYEALAPRLIRENPGLTTGGRFPAPDWLQPIPPPAARKKVTQESMTRFVADEGMLDLANQVKSFVREHIFPEIPLMLGVDHSMTGGVISSLAERLGPENLSVLILDQHFDGLPLSLRVDTAMLSAAMKSARTAPPSTEGEAGDLAEDLANDAYCCGNFLKYLIDDGTVLPEHLLLMGVGDYPGDKAPPGGEKFRENYLALEKRGCRFFPSTRFEQNINGLAPFIMENVTTPYLYVSLDVDVGALQCVHAARYMDTMGISKTALQQAARCIADGCRQGRFRLAGLDAVEFNMHFLGLEFEPGKKDATLAVAHEFITEMLTGHSNPG